MKEQVESPVGVGTCTITRGVLLELLSIDLSFPPSSTFSEGIRSCLGWGFACADHLLFYFRGAERSLLGSVIEIHTFLVTLIREFDISQADHRPKSRG